MFGKAAPVFRMLIAIGFSLAFLASWTLPTQAEGDGQAIMNWRLSLPQAAPKSRATPAYRPRRRTDDVLRYEDDSALGLHMPAIRVEVPILADPNAPKIAVIGDSLAEALAAGFEGDTGMRTAYRLVERTRSASGLVRDDYFNWPTNLSALMQEHRDLAAVVIMIGLNDRQILKVGDVSQEPLSDGWREEYRKRIEALLVIARDKRVPVVWVGLPLMRAPRLSADLVSINGILQERVANFGQNFVETIDAFADANGAFSATGPDVIGDMVRLRGPDGIHFTPAGQRKLAFFVDRVLRRLVGEGPSPTLANLPSQPEASVSAPSPASLAPSSVLPGALGSVASTLAAPVFAPARPAIGERRTLGEIRPEGTLISGRTQRFGETVNRNLFDRGIAPDSRPGRSDDHGWR